MNTYIRDMIIILSMIVGYSIFFVEYTFAQDAAKVRSSQRSSEKPVSVKTYKPEEPVSIKAYKSIDEDFNLDLTISFTNKEKTPITNIVFLVSVFGNGWSLRTYNLEISAKGNCPAGETRVFQQKCYPRNFSSDPTSLSDEYYGYISVTKIRYSNGRVWSGNRDSEKYWMEWMQ